METEEEAREATDGQEVQVEAVDLGTSHLQTHLDGKLSSNKEIKGKEKIMDSTEGMLKIPEDQVLVQAPSEVEIPPELNLNGTAPSLNGHLDKDKISNEQPYENDQNDKEHVEVSPDGTSTDQSNKSNDEEVTDSLGHGESTTKGTSLLKHENEEPKEYGQEELEGGVMDTKMVHEDTLKTDNAVEQTVDPQQGQNLESAKATEDTQPASVSNILDDEVVAEAPVGVQTPLEPNLDDSDALPDTIDGNTETVEPAKADDVAHLDHKESSAEDEDSAEHTDEVAEVEDQHSKQTDSVDAYVVQEETPKSKETEDPNVDDSDALPDIIDGNIETVEPARADDVTHLDHKESSPEDKDIEEHTDEVVQEEDKHSKQTDAVDADVVQEETPKSKETEDPNVDDSDALPDIIDGNIETVEPARADDVTHLDHKESSPEDKDIEEHTDEVVQEEDKHSKQTDAVDADVVQEETPKSKETEDPNVDDSDALPDIIDGNIETVEPARADDVTHLDHKESSPEDKDIEEHTDEVVQEEDKHSKQTDAVDADVVQEEIPKSKETEVQEEMPKTEQVDDSTIDAHVLNQELPEETNDPVYEKTEETSHQSSVAASEETTPDNVAMREPAVNVQEVQNQGSVEEMIDVEAVDTEKTMQQSSAAFEEEIPEDHVATTAPSSDIQHVHNVESEEIKGLEDAKAEETSKESNVAFAEDAVQDKVLPSEPTVDIQPAEGLGQEETENIGTVEMDEASNQMHPVVHNNLAQEDGIAESESHVTELAEEVEDIEATETQEITHQCHAATSKELSTEDNLTASELHNDDIEQVLEQDSVEVKDTEAAETQGICHERTISTSEEDTVEGNVTAEGPTCYTQEVQSVESPDEIKDSIAEKITEASNATTVDEADQENNVLTSEAIAEQQTRELEPEEIKNTEPVDIEASDQRHAALFNDLAQEDNMTVDEMQKTEPVVETKEIEATKTEAIPQESNASISEEPTPEDHITASETTSDTQEVNNIGSAESIEGNKDTKTEEISDHGNESFAVEATEGNDALESEANADIQPVQEMESEEMMNTELVAVSETSHQMDDAVFQKPTQEDNPTASELHVMESAGEVSNIEATEAQATPHQTNVAQSEEQATEENTTAREPQILEPESVEDMDTDATEPQGISQQSIVSTTEESVPEENVTAKEPAYDNKEVQNEEPELIKEHNDMKAEEISNQSGRAFVGEAAQENSLLASEPANDVQVKGLESEDTRNTEDVGTEEASHQTHVATVEENLTASEPQMIESLEQMNSIEPTRPEPTLHESNTASLQEMATEDSATIGPDVGIQQLQEQESVQFRDIEAIEPQGISPSHIVCTSEESTPEDNVTLTTTEPSFDTEAENLESAEVIKDTEDVKSNVALAEDTTPEEHVLATEATIDVPPVQELELEENKNTKPVETQDNITESDLPAEEVKDTEAMETEEIPHESTVASISEFTEDVKSNVEAAPEEHVLATEATVIPPGQEPELEEVKNTEPVEVEDTITAGDLPAEEMDSETMDTEAIPHASTVASIKELTEDGILTASAPHSDIHQVPEQESVEDMKCTATTEYQGEPQQSTVSTSDEHTPTEAKTTVTEPTCGTQVQNIVAQEIKDSEDVQTEEFSDHSTFYTPEVTDQESAVPGSEPTSDAQQAQEQDSTEETRGIEAVETEDYQQHGVSTLEKPVPENNWTESEPKVDDQQVQEEKLAVEVKDTEAMETEEISNQSNTTTSENAAQESSELGSGPDFYVQPVQPAQQLEFAEDSKGSQPVKAEETGQSNFATLEEPTAEDNATNEIGPPADIKQEYELESVEEIKDIDATEAEDASHTSQAAALEESPSESNIATTEPTYDIQQVNELEATKEMKATEAINAEEISCQQTEISVLEDQSSTDNGTAPEELPVESNEENIGDEIDNVMLVHEKIKDEMQESTEQKDEASNLGEKTVFTTQKGENITEVDAVQISRENSIETSHNIDQIIEDPKAVTEHDSSQMLSDQSEENITHVQDRDIKGELLTESGTEEVPQAAFENDPQAAQDVAEKDDTIKSGEQINDQDNEQHHDLVLQTQVCERSMDALAIGQQDEDVQKVNLDEDVQKVNLDQQQKEGDEIEVQTEQIQTDEQKHDDKRADFTTEPLVEPQSIEVVTNRTEDTDVFEAERTETVVTEMLKNENTLHVPQESIPRISAKVENITERKEGTEEENKPNNTGPLDADAENYNKDEQENTEKDAVVAKASTDEQYEATDEIRKEEVEPGLSSSVEKDLQEISDPAPSNDEMQENVSDENLATENNGVEAEAMQQKVHSTNAETNNDDILSISDPLPAHQTVTASDINQYRQYQKAINADGVLQLEPEENASDKIVETDSNEKMETFGKAVTFDEDTCDKASGADGALSDESLKTFEDTRRNLDISSVVTASKGESINEGMEDHKLALPAQPTLDENTTEQAYCLEETERELSLSEKPLPAEPEEQEDNQITKEQDEEDMHEPAIGDTQKEAEESDLPVSNFLMNLILGKESNDPNGNLESEAEKKQEEITKDDSCLITSQQEESSVSFPAENKVDDKLISEQEKQNVEGSEGTHETVKEQSHDFKLDTEISLETDEQHNRNTHDSETPVYQDNAPDEISSVLVPGEATGLVTETETRDFELGEKAVDTICQEDVEATTQIEEGSLKSNLDDSTSPKASQEDTLEEGRTELLHESVPEDRSSDAVAEQTLSLTEPDMGNAEKLPNNTDGLQSPLCTKQEESIVSSNVEAKSTTEVQQESEVDKKEENQHATTSGAPKEQIENLHDNSQKGTGSEAISDEQAPEIIEPVSGTDLNLAHEKEISEGSTCKDEKESYNFSKNEKALEFQSDAPNLHINQDKQDESADSQIVIEKNNLLEKPGESNLQEQQETDTTQKSTKETDEGYQKFLVIKEPVIKEENVHETVESHVQTVNIKPNDEQEVDSQVQEHDLNVVSPKEAPEVEESFVEITKPEFSTDEEQSPKADELNMAEEKTYDEKTKDEEEAKNFTDEATMKIEERGAGQKASNKKHNIFSSVGSKVKHQLAKVKKAIIGKPGHTKSESPKS